MMIWIGGIIQLQQKVQSPFSQINYYKENLVSLHISTFLEKKMNKWYYSNIIYTLVYFHKMSQDNIGEIYT